MRMTIELPDAARRMMPSPHRVVTEHNSLLADSDLGQLVPGTESGRDFASSAIMIPFHKMDVLAKDAVAIARGLVRAALAEVTQKKQLVVLADLAIQVGKNSRIHLTR